MKEIKSNYFQIKKRYGGGVTSEEEIKSLLELLVAKGFFEKRLEKNGQYSYKEKKGTDREKLSEFLKSF